MPESSYSDQTRRLKITNMSDGERFFHSSEGGKPNKHSLAPKASMVGDFNKGEETSIRSRGDLRVEEPSGSTEKVETAPAVDKNVDMTDKGQKTAGGQPVGAARSVGDMVGSETSAERANRETAERNARIGKK